MAKIIGAVVAVVVVIGAFFVWQSKQAGAPMDESGAMAPKAESGESMMEKGMGAVASIKDAMGLGKSMQCSYSVSEDQSIQSSVVVDGQKFKSTTVMKDMTVYGLFDGEMQYTWMSNSKQGMKMSKSCLEQMTNTVKDMTKPETSAPAARDMRDELDMAKNVSCQPAAGVDWSLPKDITFVDQCAMMQDSMKMLQEMKDKLPAGMEMPVMPNAAY